MSIVSHLHHLFTPETCQSYIHTWRWKDRPLQCPRCQSLNVGPWGTYHAQPGLKRYRWCGWLRNVALSYEMGRKLEGTVEADDLYPTAGHKGQAKTGGTKALGRQPRGRRKKREPGRGTMTKIGRP